MISYICSTSNLLHPPSKEGSTKTRRDKKTSQKQIMKLLRQIGSKSLSYIIILHLFRGLYFDDISQKKVDKQSTNLVYKITYQMQEA